MVVFQSLIWWLNSSRDVFAIDRLLVERTCKLVKYCAHRWWVNRISYFDLRDHLTRLVPDDSFRIHIEFWRQGYNRRISVDLEHNSCKPGESFWLHLVYHWGSSHSILGSNSPNRLLVDHLLQDRLAPIWRFVALVGVRIQMSMGHADAHYIQWSKALMV